MMLFPPHRFIVAGLIEKILIVDALRRAGHNGVAVKIEQCRLYCLFPNITHALFNQAAFVDDDFVIFTGAAGVRVVQRPELHLPAADRFDYRIRLAGTGGDRLEQIPNGLKRGQQDFIGRCKPAHAHLFCRPIAAGLFQHGGFTKSAPGADHFPFGRRAINFLLPVVERQERDRVFSRHQESSPI